MEHTVIKTAESVGEQTVRAHTTDTHQYTCVQAPGPVFHRTRGGKSDADSGFKKNVPPSIFDRDSSSMRSEITTWHIGWIAELHSYPINLWYTFFASPSVNAKAFSTDKNFNSQMEHSRCLPCQSKKDTFPFEREQSAVAKALVTFQMLFVIMISKTRPLSGQTCDAFQLQSFDYMCVLLHRCIQQIERNIHLHQDVPGVMRWKWITGPLLWITPGYKCPFPKKAL